MDGKWEKKVGGRKERRKTSFVRGEREGEKGCKQRVNNFRDRKMKSK